MNLDIGGKAVPRRKVPVILTVIMWDSTGLPAHGFQYKFFYAADPFLTAYHILTKGGYAI